MESVETEENIEEEGKDIIEYTPIILQILNINSQIEELDEYFNQLPSLQSKVDEELSDLLHYIENNDLTPKQSAKMIKLLHEKRLERRRLCNDYEIKKVYNTHKAKLVIDTQRPFFNSEIYKKAKELNCKYKNRQLEDDIIKDLIK